MLDLPGFSGPHLTRDTALRMAESARRTNAEQARQGYQWRSRRLDPNQRVDQSDDDAHGKRDQVSLHADTAV